MTVTTTTTTMRYDDVADVVDVAIVATYAAYAVAFGMGYRSVDATTGWRWIQTPFRLHWAFLFLHGLGTWACDVASPYVHLHWIHTTLLVVVDGWILLAYVPEPWIDVTSSDRTDRHVAAAIGWTSCALCLSKFVVQRHGRHQRRDDERLLL